MRLTLVRHGVTEWNAVGRWQGHADTPLSPDGERQARLLGRRLAGERFDLVYTSDLSRAARTA
ncbi:histidine phosphatase family protein, partial [Deinococcus pimensis]|uniref:histidine phosphatase family protein n=1 Tax=Deinococcus pimensis TaxID=309888 RepID=UPI0005EB7B58